MVAATSTSAPAASPTAHGPLPTALSPLDQALLTRLYDRATLSDLFDSLKAEPIDGAPASRFALTEWACREDIKPWIDIHANQQRESEQREMIALLKEIARNSENQVERRRAASTILRTLSSPSSPSLREGAGGRERRTSRSSQPKCKTDPPSSPTGGGGRAAAGGGSVSTLSTEPPGAAAHPSAESATTDKPQPLSALNPQPSSHARPLSLPPIPPPSPDLRPEKIAHLALMAANRRHIPDYLAKLKDFLAPDATFEGRPITDVPSQCPPFHPNGAISFLIRGQPTPTQVQVRVTAANPPHQLITFTRSSDGPFPHCWLISDISLDTS